MRRLLVALILLAACSSPTQPEQSPYSLYGKVLSSPQLEVRKTRIVDVEGDRVEDVYYRKRWMFNEGTYVFTWIRSPNDTLLSSAGTWGEKTDGDWPYTQIWTQRTQGWIVQPHENWRREPLPEHEIANVHDLEWSADGKRLEWDRTSHFDVFWISGARP